MTLTVDGTLYFYFLSHISYSMNKLKSHMLFTYKNLMFFDFTKKKIFCSNKWWWGLVPPLPISLRPWIYTYIHIYTCILCSEYVILLKGSKSLRITSKIEPHVSFYMFSHVSLFSHVSFLTSMNSKGNYFVCVSRI